MVYLPHMGAVPFLKWKNVLFSFYNFFFFISFFWVAETSEFAFLSALPRPTLLYLHLSNKEIIE